MKILDELKNAGFVFNKSLGQNFIVDECFLDSLVKELALTREDTVVEIGAGAGTLTKAIAPKVKKVLSFEIDKKLEKILDKQFENISNIDLYIEDGLKTDKLPNEPYKVVANIPYYITTPLIMKFMRDPNCMQINVLVQTEFGQRMVAKHRTHEYGALSVGVQSWGNARIMRAVPRNMFIPRPNVDSVFVQVKKHAKNSEYYVDDPVLFERMLKTLFAARRKKISNGLSSFLNLSREETIKILKTARIDENVRPEVVSVGEYIKLLHTINQ